MSNHVKNPSLTILFLSLSLSYFSIVIRFRFSTDDEFFNVEYVVLEVSSGIVGYSRRCTKRMDLLSTMLEWQ